MFQLHPKFNYRRSPEFRELRSYEQVMYRRLLVLSATTGRDTFPDDPAEIRKLLHLPEPPEVLGEAWPHGFFSLSMVREVAS